MDAFETLEIWKRSSRLCTDIYKALSDCREWGFRQQVTRSALSIPSSIAEGYERNSRNEYLRFLKIAKGSCGEMRTQLYIAQELGLLDKNLARRFVAESVELSKMLQGLIRTLERRTD